MGTENQEDIDYLDLPDDEMLAMEAPPIKEAPPVEKGDEVAPPAAIEPPKEEDDGDEEEEDEEGEEGEGTGTGVEDKAVVTAPADAAPTEAATLNFEEEYKKLIAPFKANGKDMQVASIEEARTLMSMGANYNKKMAGLKPSLRILKTLENNGLLDEDRLNFLIDLDKKDPGAINKLLKDSGINPLNLDIEEAATYTPKTYNATNKEVELDAVLDEIRETTAFKDTIQIIGNRWDEESRRVLVDNPTIIKAINDHVSAGIYDQITARVEKERMLGRLNGVSDIAAYKQMGDAMQAAGEFTPKPAPSTKQVAPPVQQQQQKASNLAKKKAAGSTVKTTGKSAMSDQEFNPLSMSDEEFAKMASSKFF